MNLLSIKIKQIDLFHYENWIDFRANLVLRSKTILKTFLKKNLIIINQHLSQDTIRNKETRENLKSDK